VQYVQWLAMQAFQTTALTGPLQYSSSEQVMRYTFSKLLLHYKKSSWLVSFEREAGSSNLLFVLKISLKGV
jgi:hypothetical protein